MSNAHSWRVSSDTLPTATNIGPPAGSTTGVGVQLAASTTWIDASQDLLLTGTRISSAPLGSARYSGAGRRPLLSPVGMPPHSPSGSEALPRLSPTSTITGAPGVKASRVSYSVPGLVPVSEIDWARAVNESSASMVASGVCTPNMPADGGLCLR
ncbi:MAG: hypothetical protein ACI8PZ_004275 [Myxococcota bacterium]